MFISLQRMQEFISVGSVLAAYDENRKKKMKYKFNILWL